MPKSREKIFIKESELNKNSEKSAFDSSISKENLQNLETEKFLESNKNNQDLQREQFKKTIIAEKHNIIKPERQEHQPVVILPVDKKTYERGLRKDPNSSLRWLIEWCQRLMKMYQFVYQTNSKEDKNSAINDKVDTNLFKKIILIIIPLAICSLFVWLVSRMI